MRSQWNCRSLRWGETLSRGRGWTVSGCYFWNFYWMNHCSSFVCSWCWTHPWLWLWFLGCTCQRGTGRRSWEQILASHQWEYFLALLAASSSGCRSNHSYSNPGCMIWADTFTYRVPHLKSWRSTQEQRLAACQMGTLDASRDRNLSTSKLHFWL